MELHWTNYWTTLLIPLIAIAVAWISFQQWKTASDKLRLDLFEKRLLIYQAVVNVMGQVSSNGRVTWADVFSYRIGVMQAQWLFGNDVWKYLDEDFDAMLVKHRSLDGELIEHQKLHPQFHDTDIQVERKRIVDARTEVGKWFPGQRERLSSLFRPYLAFDKPATVAPHWLKTAVLVAAVIAIPSALVFSMA